MLGPDSDQHHLTLAVGRADDGGLVRQVFLAGVQDRRRQRFLLSKNHMNNEFI